MWLPSSLVHWWHSTCWVALSVWPSSQCWDRLPDPNIRKAFPHGAGDATQRWRGRGRRRDNTWGKGDEYIIFVACIFMTARCLKYSEVAVFTKTQADHSILSHVLLIPNHVEDLSLLFVAFGFKLLYLCGLKCGLKVHFFGCIMIHALDLQHLTFILCAVNFDSFIFCFYSPPAERRKTLL